MAGKLGTLNSCVRSSAQSEQLKVCNMSNFCGAFDDNSWPRKHDSEGAQRRSGGPGTFKRSLPPLNPLPAKRGAHSGHHTRLGGEGEGGRDGVGQWGKQQFNRNRARSYTTGRGPGVGAVSGQAGVRQGEPSQGALRTAIKDLYPHQPNTVSNLPFGYNILECV